MGFPHRTVKRYPYSSGLPHISLWLLSVSEITLKIMNYHIIRMNSEWIIKPRQNKTKHGKTVHVTIFHVHSVGIKSSPRVAKWTCHVKRHWWLFKCINYISVMSRIYTSQLLTWKWMRCEKVQYSATLDDKIVKKRRETQAEYRTVVLAGVTTYGFQNNKMRKET